jgi:hydrogenase maturation factor
MSGEQREQPHLIQYELTLSDDASCTLDAEGHCITCSDEALQVYVQQVDEESGLAQVTINDTSEEIDITLVERVAPGDILLVHGGVAIARVEEASNA